jgi:pimeloyl-ACP methyl ester carboxylesterase
MTDAAADGQPFHILQALEISEDGHGKRHLAVRFDAGSGVRSHGPGLFWLPGLRSDMASTKASAVAHWAMANGVTMTRFDYSGHGQSSGRFEDGTISLWLADALAVLARATGPQILIGSSMGGWIALRMLQVLTARGEASRLAGLLLIAPAWDMTEALMWEAMAPEARETLLRDGQWQRPSDYAPDGYLITRALIDDGRQHLLPARLAVPCPVHILHGRFDTDVPFTHSQALMARLDAADVTMTDVPDGDHRLSRAEDIARLITVVAALVT